MKCLCTFWLEYILLSDYDLELQTEYNESGYSQSILISRLS